MDHDFVYCPGCARYSIVTFKPELRAWECDDCTYTQPMDEEVAQAPPGLLAA